MNKITRAILVAATVLTAVVVVSGQTFTPLTNLMNIRGTTDANGSLNVYGRAASGANTPLTPLSNLMGRTDSNGSLTVAMTGGAMTPDFICLDATNQDMCLKRIASGVAQFGNATTVTGFNRLILGTNDPTANGIAIKNAAGTVDLVRGDDSAWAPARALSFTSTAGMVVGTKVTAYNAVNTAGWGTPAVYGQATTGTVTNSGTASIATYTVGAADGVFMVGCNVSITVSTTHSFSCDVTYTDVTNAARTMVLPVEGLAGTFLTNGLMTNVIGAGPYESATMNIRAKASTAITVRTSSGGTFTTVTYTASGSIVQIG